MLEYLRSENTCHNTACNLCYDKINTGCIICVHSWLDRKCVIKKELKFWKNIKFYVSHSLEIIVTYNN